MHRYVLPAHPDIVDVDHPPRIAFRARVAPSAFAILFLRSSLALDSLVSRRALSVTQIALALGSARQLSWLRIVPEDGPLRSGNYRNAGLRWRLGGCRLRPGSRYLGCWLAPSCVL